MIEWKHLLVNIYSPPQWLSTHLQKEKLWQSIKENSKNINIQEVRKYNLSEIIIKKLIPIGLVQMKIISGWHLLPMKIISGRKLIPSENNL